MTTAEQSLPWWKSDRLINIVIPSLIGVNAVILTLVAALLIYSLARTDQQFADVRAQFTAQTARIDSLHSELTATRIEMTDIKADVRQIKEDLQQVKEDVEQIKEDVPEINARLLILEEQSDRIETNQQEIMSEFDAHEQQHEQENKAEDEPEDHASLNP